MKAKRLVSLLMALMLVIGIFAVPAMAAQDDDGIELYGPVIRCDCGASISTSSTETWNESGFIYTGCDLTSKTHIHEVAYRCTGYRCSSCGAKIYLSKMQTKNKCTFITS
ncbi:hypothetical protein AALA61_15670 [Oscillospiraceae bacterium 42-9]